MATPFILSLPFGARAADRWGEAAGFPTGWGPPGQRQQWEGYTEYHVGNFSGGLETMFPSKTIKCSGSPAPLVTSTRKIRVSAFFDASDYADRTNASSLLVGRGGEIWHEEYRFRRTADMRLFGWSMTKSVVSLLFGIAFDEHLIEGLDDPVGKYVVDFSGHSLADTTLRNLLNMSSGANICQERCEPKNSFERFEYSQIGYSPNRGRNTDMAKGLLDFSWGRSEPQGTRFNYSEICPQLIAWVLQSVFRMPLYAIAEQYLWEPMGAEADAAWLTDAKGFALAAAGFSATLRDWARLGFLVANDGAAQGRQIVSKSWIDECSRHSDRDQQVRYNVALKGRGYRNFFWHQDAEGRVIRMAGAKGQFVVIDRKTKTVLVRTGVSDENGADEQMMALFDVACRL